MSLAAALGAGRDLRIVTQFRHNEHVDPISDNDELVLEPSSFPVTIALYSDTAAATGATSRLPSFVAGIMTARQPVNPNDSTGPGGFNGRGEAALSLFLYYQDGQQARAAVQLTRGAFAASTPPPPEPEAEAEAAAGEAASAEGADGARLA